MDHEVLGFQDVAVGAAGHHHGAQSALASLQTSKVVQTNADEKRAKLMDCAGHQTVNTKKSSAGKP
jgi:hypothetical protein